VPRYLLEARTISRARRDAAAGLAATRFPEVVVDLRYAAHEQEGVDVWVCRAPSELHVRRWARTAGLDVHLLQPVDTDPG
jgi:hypothetical protein